MSHYYLVASLPTLELGDDPPFTCEEFLFQCGGVLSEEEHDLLRAVLRGEPVPESSFAGRWRDISVQIRNTIARQRAPTYNVDARKYTRPSGSYSSYVDTVVTDAMAHNNPIERERALDRGRMKLAAELAVGRPFSFEAVLAFAIQLTILERWKDMSADEGREKLDRLIDEQTREREAEEGDPDLLTQEDLAESMK